MSDCLRTALYDSHLEAGGRMVSFAGWEMPVMYSGIMPEHKAVRSSCGVFDISHMGQVWVEGSSEGCVARDWLNGLLTNDLSRLEIGEGQYSLMLNVSGGVIDDLIVYRCGEDKYFLVINASKRSEDVEWMTSSLVEGVSLKDASDEFVGLAVQGPNAAVVWKKYGESNGRGNLPEMPRRNEIVILDNGDMLCGTGYTGEAGFEYFTSIANGASAWEGLLAKGAVPCGLGARDTLRLEMGYPLNGSDLASDKTPLEAGLGFFVKLDQDDFVGKEVLVLQKANGIEMKLVGIAMDGKSPPPRSHYKLFSGDDEIGELSSGAISPSLGFGIGMAYVPIELSKLGSSVEVEIRGKKFPAKVVRKPFYRKD